MVDLIVAGILLILVAAAVHTIRKEKKKGAGCIGCPSSGGCSGRKCCNAEPGRSQTADN